MYHKNSRLYCWWIQSLLYLHTDYVLGDTTWRVMYRSHIKEWIDHATFWLEEWTGPIHILIYRDLIEDFSREYTNLLLFFGFPFDKYVSHRYCCILRNSFNSNLKRGKSAVDEYKVRYLYRIKKLSVLSKRVTDTSSIMTNSYWYVEQRQKAVMKMT